MGTAVRNRSGTTIQTDETGNMPVFRRNQWFQVPAVGIVTVPAGPAQPF